MEKINKKLKFSAAFRDLIILGLTTIFVFIVSYFFNIFNFLVKIFYQNPQTIVYIDEIITVLLTLSVGLTIFSWRRWQEFRKEAAEHIKNQEMLREVAETKAEVERIISKQLRTDMDQLKHEVKEILYLLTTKHKQ
ncbi:MAG: hypothetical protein M0R48_07750 [Candidatus Omnitrophica bacterium]|jgi:hypothetical protein|nr:hypothetical protein [Candidatus Omnitrophota bacterium]